MFNFLVYNKFKNKKWSWLSPKKRLIVFQKMENIMAKKCGRPPYQIIPKDWGNDIMGLCVYEDEIIFLNSMFFLMQEKQFLGLATLFHEERHAQQHFLVKNKKKFFRFSKAYKWKKDMENYIVYDRNGKYSYYSMQNVERDANKFAIKQLQKFGFRFRNEQLYYDALELKTKIFYGTKEFAKKELGPFYKLKLFLRRKKEEKKNKRGK